MTGESPLYPVTPGYEGENNTLVNHLESLKQKEHIKDYEPATGHYEGLENSYLIHSPNFEKIKDLGNKLGQESVILSNNGKHYLHYTNGENKGKAHPHIKGEDVISHSTRPDDYFTETSGHKAVRFTIPVDFGNLEI